jgi:hypothetical protein
MNVAHVVGQSGQVQVVVCGINEKTLKKMMWYAMRKS